MIKVNLDKSKEIHKENLRLYRSEVLKKLDIEFMRAVESGDTESQSSIAAKKQELRDITKAAEIENATSVEDLKSHWPEILNYPNIYEAQQ